MTDDEFINTEDNLAVAVSGFDSKAGVARKANPAFAIGFLRINGEVIPPRVLRSIAYFGLKVY